MVKDDGDFGGGGGAGWQLLDHPGLLLAIAVFVLVLLVAMLVAVWIIMRRMRRSPRVARGLLQLRAEGLPAGPGRELAALRLSLAKGIDYTTESVALAGRSGRPVGDLPALVGRLAGLASSLDEQLRAWEREPDPVRLGTVLPLARSRTQELTTSATRIRVVLGQLEAAESVNDGEALTADVAMEVEALQAGVASFGKPLPESDQAI